MMTKKILWLTSWYPNHISPYEGDFIQRHARAVTTYTRIIVFYMSQAGEAVDVNESQFIEHEKEGVIEKIFFFKFKKTGFKWVDKLRYNISYYKTYKKAIKDYIHHTGEPDFVHVHVPMKAGMIALWIKRRWKIPYIVSEHSSLYNNSSVDSFYKKSLLHRRSVKKIFRNAIAVTNVSANVAGVIKDLFHLSFVKVIYNTVNTSLFNYKNFDPVKFRFIHVSTLTPQKNVEGILNAVKNLSKQRKNFELVIVGPISSELVKLIDQLELSSFVSYTGEITYAEVAVQMQNASAFIMFSRHENFPCVIIEALCCGLPCIATNVGGVPEAINESNGILVESEIEQQLYEAMNKMMDYYSEFDKEKIAIEAQQKYNYATIGKHFYDLYEEILAKQSTL